MPAMASRSSHTRTALLVVPLLAACAGTAQPSNGPPPAVSDTNPPPRAASPPAAGSPDDSDNPPGATAHEKTPPHAGHGGADGHGGHHGHAVGGAHGHGGHHGHGAGGSPAPGHRHTGGHHRFDDAEAWAKVFDDPTRDTWQRPDDVIASLALEPDDVVADIGAGTGYFTVRLAKAVPRGRVIATDIEPDMVAYLKDRARRAELSNVHVVRNEADDPKLPDGIDVALVVDVYHHIADPATFFGKVRTKLAPGGRVVIVDFRTDAPEDAPGPPPSMRLSPVQVATGMKKAGFRLARTDVTTLPYQYILEFRPQ